MTSDLPAIGASREMLRELGMDDTTIGDRCMATSLGELLRNPLRPPRCGAPAVLRVFVDHCSSMECSPWDCQGHPTCQQHFKDMNAARQLEHSEPL